MKGEITRLVETIRTRALAGPDDPSSPSIVAAADKLIELLAKPETTIPDKPVGTSK